MSISAAMNRKRPAAEPYQGSEAKKAKPDAEDNPLQSMFNSTFSKLDDPSADEDIDPFHSR